MSMRRFRWIALASLACGVLVSAQRPLTEVRSWPVDTIRRKAIALAAGQDVGLAVLDDRTVATWGNNEFRSAGNLPAGLTDVVDVAAGFSHFLALRSNGTVVGWPASSPLPPGGLSSVVGIAAGEFHSL